MELESPTSSLPAWIMLATNDPLAPPEMAGSQDHAGLRSFISVCRQVLIETRSRYVSQAGVQLLSQEILLPQPPQELGPQVHFIF